MSKFFSSSEDMTEEVYEPVSALLKSLLKSAHLLLLNKL